MARLPHGAVALVGAVQSRRPRASYSLLGQPDGLHVYRTIKFDKRTSKWLAPLLDQIADPRVDEAKVTDAGYLHVTFSPKPIADRRDPWPLDEAEQVTRGGPSDEDRRGRTAAGTSQPKSPE